jgi:IS1 family transposase
VTAEPVARIADHRAKKIAIWEWAAEDPQFWAWVAQDAGSLAPEHPLGSRSRQLLRRLAVDALELSRALTDSRRADR